VKVPIIPKEGGVILRRPKGTYPLPEEAKGWTVHEIKIWCRKKLCGAPPANPIDPQNDIELKWNEVKLHAGKRISLHSNFPGLIMNDVFNMATEGTPPMTANKKTRELSSDSILQNITNSDMVVGLEGANDMFWSGVKNLVDWYNQEDMKDRHNGKMMWQAGKEMLNLQQNVNKKLGSDYVREVSLYYSIEQWGVGLTKNGYGKRQLYCCLEMYKWLGEENLDHPIMESRTNPVMKLMMKEGENRERRMNLFLAYNSGPLMGMSDEQFGWMLGMSENTFPTPGRWNDLQSLREKIAKGEDLSEEELVNLQSIMQDL
jgi:hypothetical protein